jgi:hypothetical protein
MRENTIKVSDGEKEQLDRARDDIFGSDSVPYGEVIEALVEDYYE